MDRSLQRLLTIGLLVLAVGSHAHAAGMGFVLTSAETDGEWTFSQDFPDLDVDVDISAKRLGFFLDTRPLAGGLLNYRLNAGLVLLESEFGSNGKIDLTGVFSSHTWGFKIFASDSIRVWAGPQVRASFYLGELENADSNDAVFFDLGAAAAVGVNFGLGDRMTLGIETGYSSTYSVGVVTFDETFASDLDVDGQDDGVYLSLSLTFGR